MQKTSKQYEEEKAELTNKNEILTKEVKKAREQLSNSSGTIRKMEKNLSSLYRTSRAEIQRLKHQLQELQTRYDHLVVQRSAVTDKRLVDEALYRIRNLKPVCHHDFEVMNADFGKVVRLPDSNFTVLSSNVSYSCSVLQVPPKPEPTPEESQQPVAQPAQTDRRPPPSKRPPNYEQTVRRDYEKEKSRFISNFKGERKVSRMVEKSGDEKSEVTVEPPVEEEKNSGSSRTLAGASDRVARLSISPTYEATALGHPVPKHDSEPSAVRDLSTLFSQSGTEKRTLETPSSRKRPSKFSEEGRAYDLRQKIRKSEHVLKAEEKVRKSSQKDRVPLMESDRVTKKLHAEKTLDNVESRTVKVAPDRPLRTVRPERDEDPKRNDRDVTISSAHLSNFNKSDPVGFPFGVSSVGLLPAVRESDQTTSISRKDSESRKSTSVQSTAERIRVAHTIKADPKKPQQSVDRRKKVEEKPSRKINLAEYRLKNRAPTEVSPTTSDHETSLEKRRDQVEPAPLPTLPDFVDPRTVGLLEPLNMWLASVQKETIPPDMQADFEEDDLRGKEDVVGPRGVQKESLVVKRQKDTTREERRGIVEDKDRLKREVTVGASSTKRRSDGQTANPTSSRTDRSRHELRRSRDVAVSNTSPTKRLANRAGGAGSQADDHHLGEKGLSDHPTVTPCLPDVLNSSTENRHPKGDDSTSKQKSSGSDRRAQARQRILAQGSVDPPHELSREEPREKDNRRSRSYSPTDQARSSTKVYHGRSNRSSSPEGDQMRRTKGSPRRRGASTRWSRSPSGRRLSSPLYDRRDARDRHGPEESARLNDRRSRSSSPVAMRGTPRKINATSQEHANYSVLGGRDAGNDSARHTDSHHSRFPSPTSRTGTSKKMVRSCQSPSSKKKSSSRRRANISSRRSRTRSPRDRSRTPENEDRRSSRSRLDERNARGRHREAESARQADRSSRQSCSLSPSAKKSLVMQGKVCPKGGTSRRAQEGLRRDDACRKLHSRSPSPRRRSDLKKRSLRSPPRDRTRLYDHRADDGLKTDSHSRSLEKRTPREEISLEGDEERRVPSRSRSPSKDRIPAPSADSRPQSRGERWHDEIDRRAELPDRNSRSSPANREFARTMNSRDPGRLVESYTNKDHAARRRSRRSRSGDDCRRSFSYSPEKRRSSRRPNDLPRDTSPQTNKELKSFSRSPSAGRTLEDKVCDELVRSDGKNKSSDHSGSRRDASREECRNQNTSNDRRGRRSSGYEERGVRDLSQSDESKSGNKQEVSCSMDSTPELQGHKPSPDPVIDHESSGSSCQHSPKAASSEPLPTPSPELQDPSQPSTISLSVELSTQETIGALSSPPDQSGLTQDSQSQFISADLPVEPINREMSLPTSDLGTSVVTHDHSEEGEVSDSTATPAKPVDTFAYMGGHLKTKFKIPKKVQNAVVADAGYLSVVGLARDPPKTAVEHIEPDATKTDRSRRSRTPDQLRYPSRKSETTEVGRASSKRKRNDSDNDRDRLRSRSCSPNRKVPKRRARSPGERSRSRDRRPLSREPCSRRPSRHQRRSPSRDHEERSESPRWSPSCEKRSKLVTQRPDSRGSRARRSTSIGRRSRSRDHDDEKHDQMPYKQTRASPARVKSRAGPRDEYNRRSEERGRSPADYPDSGKLDPPSQKGNSRRRSGSRERPYVEKSRGSAAISRERTLKRGVQRDSGRDEDARCDRRQKNPRVMNSRQRRLEERRERARRSYSREEQRGTPESGPSAEYLRKNAGEVRREDPVTSSPYDTRDKERRRSRDIEDLQRKEADLREKLSRGRRGDPERSHDRCDDPDRNRRGDPRNPREDKDGPRDRRENSDRNRRGDPDRSRDPRGDPDMSRDPRGDPDESSDPHKNLDRTRRGDPDRSRDRPRGSARSRERHENHDRRETAESCRGEGHIELRDKLERAKRSDNIPERRRSHSQDRRSRSLEQHNRARLDLRMSLGVEEKYLRDEHSSSRNKKSHSRTDRPADTRRSESRERDHRERSRSADCGRRRETRKSWEDREVGGTLDGEDPSADEMSADRQNERRLRLDSRNCSERERSVSCHPGLSVSRSASPNFSPHEQSPHSDTSLYHDGVRDYRSPTPIFIGEE